MSGWKLCCKNNKPWHNSAVESPPLVPYISSMQNRLYFLRDQAVMLDIDLARVYQVSVQDLHRAVARNKGRFPSDCTFTLSGQDKKHLGVPKEADCKFAFNELGLYMLSNVLQSDHAVKISIEIVRSLGNETVFEILSKLTGED